MVFNDGESRRGARDNLRLAVSDLQGKNWTRIATLEDAANGSFAYPFIIRTHDGLFHIVFSYNLNRIKHLTLNEAWIEDRIGEEGMGFRYILDSLNPERILSAAETIGIGRRRICIPRKKSAHSWRRHHVSAQRERCVDRPTAP